MLPSQVRSEIDSLKRLSEVLLKASDEHDLGLQIVYANHMVLKSSGLLENSTKKIFGEYARRYGNAEIQSFMSKTVERENSLNCEKLKKLFDKLDIDHWKRLESKISASEREAIDSLKTIRDQVAHGRVNGTSIRIVCNYFKELSNFIPKMASELLS